MKGGHGVLFAEITGKDEQHKLVCTTNGRKKEMIFMLR